MTDLVKGALVTWPASPGSAYGVLTQVDMRQLRVRLDGDEEDRIFSRAAGAIERVTLSGMVKRVSNGSPGMIIEQSTLSPPRWKVFIDGKAVNVAESDLRPHLVEDPASRLAHGRLGTARQFALAVTARRYELENLTNELVCLGEARVDIKPHQVSVAHRVITNYPHRFLLCDEVGLGKTIEAAMVLKELRARDHANRVLIIAPPNLLRQWQFELKSKFNEVFSIINSDTVRYLKETQSFDGNPFEAYDSVLVSSAWIRDEKWSKLATSTPWDMIVVDEAHHARVRGKKKSRVETQLYRVVRDLASPEAFSKRAALFLTATPMQLDSSELYSLIEILDPALFPSEESFEAHRDSVPGLSRLVHDLTEHGYPIPGRSSEKVIAWVTRWLNITEAEAQRRLTGGESSLAALCDELSSQHLLSQILIRNRKKLVGGFMPRTAHRWQVELTQEERVALQAVESYVRDGYARSTATHNTAIGFVMVIFQKLMASSIRALRNSLAKRQQRLEAGTGLTATNRAVRSRLAEALEQIDDDHLVSLDDEDLVNHVITELAVEDAREASELKLLVDLLDAVPTDSKGDSLVRHLKDLAIHDSAPKVLLFTEFRDTQEYLRERLEPIGWDVFLFHGGLTAPQKDAAVEKFKASDRPSILLSTEAGGEGRNFQFCHLLVNYDLPWNPMRVEQRIGRVDRIGQQHTVQVFNFWVKDTVEERILDVLEHRIKVFEDTVGGLDPILGDTETDLSKILRLAGEERDRELQKFEQQIEQKLTAARHAEEKLRDFIMETKSYSKEIAATITGQHSPITPADQEAFAIRLLADVNTYLDPQEDETFRIIFNEPFLGDYPELAKGQLRKRMVAFRPDVMPDSEHVEYLALGHQVVDVLVQRVTDSAYDGTAAALEIEDGSLPETAGWLAVYELGVPGIREVRQLWPCFVSDEGIPDLSLGELLVKRCSRFPNDRALSPEDFETSGLESAVSIAESSAYEYLEMLEAAARQDSESRLEREREKLSNYFDYRDQAAVDRLAASQEVLADMERSDDPDTRRIIPVWRANVSRDERLIDELQQERERRLSELANQAQGKGDLRLVALARVEITGEQ